MVRAVASPYLGAYCEIGSNKLYIWKAALVESKDTPLHRPGVITSLSKSNQPRVQCGHGSIEIQEWTTEPGDECGWSIGVQLI